MTPQTLSEKLLALVRAQHFEELVDYHHDGQRIAHFPSIDLAVIGFPRKGAPVMANVLFSRDLPQGMAAQIAPGAGPVTNVHYLRDQVDANCDSIAWFREADWDAMSFETLARSGHLGGARFVEPYPASLVKMMMAVGIARQVDLGKLAWQQEHVWSGQTRTIAAWCEAMITESCNDSTDAMTLALHQSGAIVVQDGVEVKNEIQQRFEEFGLTTFRFRDTKPDGGWRTPNGAGVGRLCMTAWDAARLFWLLDADAPPAPWLIKKDDLVSHAGRARLRGMLARQGLHSVLSSSALAGQQGWVPGMPARMPVHWIKADGSVEVTPRYAYPPDVRWVNAQAELVFAHKTGGTDNYCSDAGIACGLEGHQRHYIVSLISSMGKRYAPPPDGVVSWKLAGLGRAVDELMKEWLEA